ncbi:MAG: glycerophosphodiester phosphodiesterase [Candidatus Hodarchaeota archaeon]
MKSNFLFIGHRGTRIDFDENTLEAFEIALKSGANYIEFDIRELNDGKIVVFHDVSLDRTTNDSGLIKDYNSTNIMNLLTKNRKCKIPFLTEVLKSLKDKIGFIIEFKEVMQWENAINIVNNENLLHQTIFSGRDFGLLKMIKNKFPNIKVCYNITKGIGLNVKDFLESPKLEEIDFPLDMINLRSDKINDIFVEKCHRHKILVLSWDFINYKAPLEKIKHLIELGIDGILFDDYNNIKTIKEYLYNR